MIWKRLRNTAIYWLFVCPDVFLCVMYLCRWYCGVHEVLVSIWFFTIIQKGNNLITNDLKCVTTHIYNLFSNKVFFKALKIW